MSRLWNIQITAVKPLPDISGGVGQMLPLQGQDFARPHSAKRGQLDDQPITNGQGREALLHLFHLHDRFAGSGSRLRRYQEPRWILPDVAFMNRQRENLMQVPPQMIHGAKRQPGGCFSIQERLKLFTLDFAEFSIAQITADMKLNPMLDRHCCGPLPPPPMNHKEHILTKVFETHLWV